MTEKKLKYSLKWTWSSPTGPLCSFYFFQSAFAPIIIHHNPPSARGIEYPVSKKYRLGSILIIFCSFQGLKKNVEVPEFPAALHRSPIPLSNINVQ